MTELDHLALELSGTNLIEASAGTGKTYAIVCLYLRLLIERQLSPQQILVVTYTEAATKELRGRVQRRIREAIKVLESAETDDPFLKRFCAGLTSPGQARETLVRALLLFDTASIFTIHGFCLRVLQDHAFESGSLYDTELVTDQKKLVRETVDDFWRMRFFSRSAPLLELALRSGFDADYFMTFVSGILGAATVRIMPQYSPKQVADIEESCRTLFVRVQQEWRSSHTSIRELLETDKGLSRSEKNYRSDLLPELFEGMAEFTADDSPFRLFAGFEKFSAGFMAQQQLKKQPPPQHPFFNLCDELLQAVQQRLLALHGELITFCQSELPLRKQQRNIRFFDDLLTNLHAALTGENGGALSAALRQTYPAALIDEFQDTDPLQYDIFRHIYAGSGLPLLLIGDPKQAIYSFRGADIFSYLQAASETAPDKRFTLTVNWRSTPALLRGLNSIFGASPQPFVYDAITFYPATAGVVDEQTSTAGPEGHAPLQIWHLPPAENGKPLTIEQASSKATLATAVEIARLLLDGTPEGQTVLPGDIAVIVRTNRQARLMQETLRTLSIPSVMRSDLSVFATHEAQEVCTLLLALSDPSSETKVRAALATDLLGATGNDIAQLIENEQAWEHHLSRFSAYHQTWLDKGFMVMSRMLMAEEGVRGRLLGHADGERRLTNLLHCFELLHETACQQQLGPEAMVTWFSERTMTREPGEAYQIRLETDDKTVRIVTIHLSKGLEYPVVFCPFTWSSTPDCGRVITFHEHFQMVKDFGSASYTEHRQLAAEESLAENLRLLYVALTRARRRCYLVAAQVGSGGKNCGQPPLAYLLHDADDEVTMEQRLQELATACPDALAVSSIADESAQPLPLSAAQHCQIAAPRTMRTTIKHDWRVTSFTAFAARDSHQHELPDRDEPQLDVIARVPPPTETPAGKSIFTFPRGAQAGIFMHELFEKLDFATFRPEAISTLVEKSLEKHGYDREWQQPVIAMLSNVVNTPLSSPEGLFTLAGLEQGSWQPELEFFFPLKFVTSGLLADCLKQHGKTAMPDLTTVADALQFRPVRGMLRGFVDMVFRQGGRYYIIDWKSNHLGFRLEDYHQQALNREMERNLYPLQYLLYSVALHRYLSLRIKQYEYEQHFGGVLYLFVRGITPQTGESCGIFRDRPTAELINALTACLIQAGG